MQPRPAVTAALIAGALWFTGTLSGVQAHEGAMGIVKERMDLMAAIGKRTKALGGMVQGKVPFDPVVAREAGAFIREASPRILPMFPPGSLDKPTEALPAIWTDWPRFESSVGDLEAAAVRLETVAAQGDRDATLGRFLEMTKVCKSCHERFRKK